MQLINFLYLKSEVPYAKVKAGQTFVEVCKLGKLTVLLCSSSMQFQSTGFSLGTLQKVSMIYLSLGTVYLLWKNDSVNCVH